MGRHGALKVRLLKRLVMDNSAILMLVALAVLDAVLWEMISPGWFWALLRAASQYHASRWGW